MTSQFAPVGSWQAVSARLYRFEVSNYGAYPLDSREFIDNGQSVSERMSLQIQCEAVEDHGMKKGVREHTCLSLK